ncbi:MAG: hypothetical protein HYV03_08075 [Deltaproteobacteria bacterium]|nr:hypothetical protein [Deltaproteobacteria bacterium]
MRRATLLLDDAIYSRVKQLSKQRGTTLKAVLNELLRRALNSVSTARAPHIRIPLHRGNGPQPGIDIADRASLDDLLEEHPLHHPQ